MGSFFRSGRNDHIRRTIDTASSSGFFLAMRRGRFFILYAAMALVSRRIIGGGSSWTSDEAFWHGSGVVLALFIALTGAMFVIAREELCLQGCFLGIAGRPAPNATMFLITALTDAPLLKSETDRRRVDTLAAIWNRLALPPSLYAGLPLQSALKQNQAVTGEHT